MISTSLVKALSILEATARHQGYRSLSDLATEARLSKPTAHRILKTLTSLGYVERTSAGQYRQSSQLRRLIGGTEDAELFNSANESLQRLHRLSGETVNLGVLRNGQISYLNVLEMPNLYAVLWRLIRVTRSIAPRWVVQFCLDCLRYDETFCCVQCSEINELRTQ